jgi:ribosomal protein S18 acetylase RimI-like enzyme
MSGITVRTARFEDLLAVLGVHARRDPDGLPPTTATETEAKTWAHMLDVPGLCVYLSETHGDVVGTASTLIFPNITYACAPTATIEAVVVAHQFRRQGIATTLLRHILEDMRSAGCNKVQLVSHKRHSVDGAHRLYASLGFEPEAEGFRLYLGEVPNAVIEARQE